MGWSHIAEAVKHIASRKATVTLAVVYLLSSHASALVGIMPWLIASITVCYLICQTAQDLWDKDEKEAEDTPSNPNEVKP
jgi:small ligand-binding sensory domain FIST